MPASTLTKRRGALQGVIAYRALTTKNPRPDLRRLQARKSFAQTSFLERFPPET
jgi:hypothetical protein